MNPELHLEIHPRASFQSCETLMEFLVEAAKRSRIIDIGKGKVSRSRSSISNLYGNLGWYTSFQLARLNIAASWNRGEVIRGRKPYSGHEILPKKPGELVAG